MLKNKYEVCIVGKNYISLINAILCRLKGHSTLLIDDSRVTLPHHLRKMGELEKILITELGKKWRLRPLYQIEKYVQLKPYYALFNKRLVKLGDSFESNLNELSRKIFLFKKLNPESYFLELKKSKNIEKHFYDFVMNRSNGRYIQGQEPSITDMFAENFYKRLKSRDREQELEWNKRYFIYFLNILNGGFCTDYVNEDHFKYILYSALLPHYSCDRLALEKVLLDFYYKIGGEEVTEKISKWSFWGDRHWVNLEKNQESIEAQTLIHFGEFKESEHPYKLVMNRGLMNLKKCKFTLDLEQFVESEIRENFNLLKGILPSIVTSDQTSKLIYTCEEAVGTSVPYLELNWGKKWGNSIKVNFFHSCQHLGEGAYFKRRVGNLTLKALNLFGEIRKDVFWKQFNKVIFKPSSDIKMGAQDYLSQEKLLSWSQSSYHIFPTQKSFGKGTLYKLKGSPSFLGKIKDTAFPYSRAQLKNFTYVGAMSPLPQGSFSLFQGISPIETS